MKKVPASNRSVKFVLLCHKHEVLVTGRTSKQQERPRYHHCKECGQNYKLTARKNQVVNCQKI